MASSSGRKSGSSGRMTPRKRVVIGAQETVRVRYRHDEPVVESERRAPRARSTEAASGSKAGKRLSAEKRDDRARRQRQIRIRRGAALAGLLVILAACVWGVFALRDSSLFTVTSVAVTGNRYYKTAEIAEKSGVRSGGSIFDVSTGAVRARLERDPRIASAVVRRDLPHTLAIEVTERKPSAVFDAGGATVWVISSDGVWLSKGSVEGTRLPTIIDVEGIRPAVGKRETDKRVLNAVAVTEGLSAQLLKQVQTISAPGIEETALRTKSDVEIFVGRAEQMNKKDRIVRAILRRHKGSVVYINVRVVDRPTWRGLESD